MKEVLENVPTISHCSQNNLLLNILNIINLKTKESDSGAYALEHNNFVCDLKFLSLRKYFKNSQISYHIFWGGLFSLSWKKSSILLRNNYSH